MSQRVLRPADTRVRAKRIETTKPLVVESKTMGTPMVYNLPMDNVSRTGLLLSMGGNRKLPFLVNTLLEMTVDPQGALFERPIQCLGKIVRMQRNEDKVTRFGVAIVQIEGKDAQTWERTLATLEAEPAQLLSVC